ncbi:MAG: toll/interleukin-1 receptor domain-containing protein, partial [Candidatus Methylumidiphilus sp.]
MHVFISYSHQQSDWVCQRLVPCLEAGGAEVLIDKDRFQIGRAVVGQMDALQDSAERHLLVLSPEYFASDYCQHEMKRAIKLDPKFDQGLVLQVRRVDCALPKAFTGWNPPLYAKLIDDRQPEPWNALLRECGANDLGTDAPAWLDTRDEIVELIVPVGLHRQHS